MPPTRTEWTRDRVKMLRQLWSGDNDLSDDDIGAIIGVPGWACKSKAHRLRLYRHLNTVARRRAEMSALGTAEIMRQAEARRAALNDPWDILRRGPKPDTVAARPIRQEWLPEELTRLAQLFEGDAAEPTSEIRRILHAEFGVRRSGKSINSKAKSIGLRRSPAWRDRHTRLAVSNGGAWSPEVDDIAIALRDWQMPEGQQFNDVPPDVIKREDRDPRFVRRLRRPDPIYSAVGCAAAIAAAA